MPIRGFLCDTELADKNYNLNSKKSVHFSYSIELSFNVTHVNQSCPFCTYVSKYCEHHVSQEEEITASSYSSTNNKCKLRNMVKNYLKKLYIFFIFTFPFKIFLLSLVMYVMFSNQKANYIFVLR